MRELLANVAVIAATATTLTFLLPQIRKLVRTRDSSGVSTSWPALGLVSNVGWFIYFVHEALWASVLAPFGASIGYGVTLWALARTGLPLNRSVLRGIALGTVLIGITATAGWPTLGVALGLTFGVMMIPTLATAFATPDPSGISPGTWWIGVLEAALWGFYGWHHADAGILTFSAMAAIGSGLMLGRYYATR
jgi:uncharacterized protein with PQ loop repeat